MTQGERARSRSNNESMASTEANGRGNSRELLEMGQRVRKIGVQTSQVAEDRAAAGSRQQAASTFTRCG